MGGESSLESDGHGQEVYVGVYAYHSLLMETSASSWGSRHFFRLHLSLPASTTSRVSSSSLSDAAYSNINSMSNNINHLNNTQGSKLKLAQVQLQLAVLEATASVHRPCPICRGLASAAQTTDEQLLS